MDKPKWQVQVIAIYYYLAALLMLVLSMLDFFRPDLAVELFPSLEGTSKEHFIIGGIFFLLIGLVDIILGFYLTRGSRVIKNIVMVLAIIGLLWSLYGIFILVDMISILFLIINIYIIWMLMFNKSITHYFLH